MSATDGKSFFMDLSRCTACRGCQIACKQWNGLPATPTKNRGSRQNPEDLNAFTYKLVRFNEVETGGTFQWLFFPEQCRHCVNPPCKAYADSINPKAIIQDEQTGAVLFTPESKSLSSVQDPMELCPYNIPRKDPKTGVWSKCTMCIDRVQQGMKPACVHSCPTGTMHFGDRAKMIEMAQLRLEEVKKASPKARLVDAGDVRVIILVETDPASYYENMQADAGSHAPGANPMTRQQFFAQLLRPLTAMRS